MPTIAVDPPVLETDRLHLRHFSADDIDPVVHLLNDPEISRYLRRVPYPYGEKDALSFLEYVVGSHAHGEAHIFSILLKPQHDMIGVISLEKIEDSEAYELGYWLGSDWHGQGLMSEAAAEIVRFGQGEAGLPCIQAHVGAGNKPSRRILEKAGLVSDSATFPLALRFGDDIPHLLYRSKTETVSA